MNIVFIFRFIVSSIQKGGSRPGGALSTTLTSSGYHIILIIRACNVFKECGPMITSMLRKFLQFNTLIFSVLV